MTDTPRFAVLLHGKGLLLLSEGVMKCGGVYCWKCVEAANEAAAVPLAIAKLQRDRIFQDEVWNSADAPPKIEVEQVDELNDAVELDEGDSACVFYLEDDGAKLAHVPKSRRSGGG